MMWSIQICLIREHKTKSQKKKKKENKKQVKREMTHYDNQILPDLNMKEMPYIF